LESSVRDAKDVLLIVFNLNSHDASDEEHTRNNIELPTNHELGGVVSLLVEQKVASALGQDKAVSTFFLMDAGRPSRQP
jgi:hypothetical protein